MAEVKKEKKRQSYVLLLDAFYILIVVFVIIKPAYETHSKTRESMEKFVKSY